MHHTIILLLCVFIVAAALVMDVEQGRLSAFGFHPPSTCALRNIFGIKCAFCGMTRSVSAAAHGRLGESVELHRFGPAVLFFILLQIPYRIYALVIRPKAVSRGLVTANAIVFAALLAGIMVNWLIYIGGLLL